MRLQHTIPGEAMRHPILPARTLPKRKDDSIIIHFDCFYAAVVEHDTPSLRSLPLAIQQKQIVVTCNYEARKRGLRKLQLISEAKRACPDLVVVLGEDLTRFRDVSKDLYSFLRAFSWNGKVERLGFDEVFMDVTDIVAYNYSILNFNHLTASFFRLSRDDPATGFGFDATAAAGHTYPPAQQRQPHGAYPDGEIGKLLLRLRLASHLALHLRQQLELRKGYTCTVGISTSKLLSKLVGNVNKPNDQTTLLPPYGSDDGGARPSNAIAFLDEHEIGKIPGIGFKMAQKIRDYVLRRPASLNGGLAYGEIAEKVLVRDVRSHPEMCADTLERILRGPGAPGKVGWKVWSLINGVDDSEVGQAREVPRQISIEDSYRRLDTMEEALKELKALAKSLIARMRADLLEARDRDESLSMQDGPTPTAETKPKWLAYPKTLRLSTRPRAPPDQDGTRPRLFNRTSRSAPLPSFVFGQTEPVDALADRLATDALVPLFRKLHPERAGWNLSLINVAVTNMVEAGSGGGGGKDASGRNISEMFKRQEGSPKPMPSSSYAKVQLRTRQFPLDSSTLGPPSADAKTRGLVIIESKSDPIPPQNLQAPAHAQGSEDAPTPSQERYQSTIRSSEAKEPVNEAEADYCWQYTSFSEEEKGDDDGLVDLIECEVCSARFPAFALLAHERFHETEN